MFKNQLQELAQRSCFNLPSYTCTREGPDHAPRFKASVNFNGETFESPTYSPTLRLAEHAAAELALCVLSSRGPSSSLTARVLDETGIYKNLLQETAHKAGLKLPAYTTVRSGPGHVPVFTCTVELAGVSFTGEPAKTKKQAEKNAAWSALKTIPEMGSLINKEAWKDHQNQVQMQSQARRRMVRGGTQHKDMNFGHPSMSGNSSLQQQHQKWRFLDLLSKDSVLGGEGSVKKHSSFVSMLPPPTAPTASKILPLKTPQNRTEPVTALAQALEEHFRDEEQWLSGKSDKECPRDHKPYGSSSCSVYRPFPLTSSSNATSKQLSGSSMVNQNTQMRNILNGSKSPIAPPVKSRSSMHTGGFNLDRRMAPAVQIRSVIPVCAAPIRPPPPSTLKPNPGEDSVSVSKLNNIKPLLQEQESSSPSPPPPPPPHSDSVSEVSSYQLSSKLQL